MEEDILLESLENLIKEKFLFIFKSRSDTAFGSFKEDLDIIFDKEYSKLLSKGNKDLKYELKFYHVNSKEILENWIFRIRTSTLSSIKGVEYYDSLKKYSDNLQEKFKNLSNSLSLLTTMSIGNLVKEKLDYKLLIISDDSKYVDKNISLLNSNNSKTSYNSKKEEIKRKKYSIKIIQDYFELELEHADNTNEYGYIISDSYFTNNNIGAKIEIGNSNSKPRPRFLSEDNCHPSYQVLNFQNQNLKLNTNYFSAENKLDDHKNTLKLNSSYINKAPSKKFQGNVFSSQMSNFNTGNYESRKSTDMKSQKVMRLEDMPVEEISDMSFELNFDEADETETEDKKDENFNISDVVKKALKLKEDLSQSQIPQTTKISNHQNNIEDGI